MDKLIIKHIPTADWPWRIYYKYDGKGYYVNGFRSYQDAKYYAKNDYSQRDHEGLMHEHDMLRYDDLTVIKL